MQFGFINETGAVFITAREDSLKCSDMDSSRGYRHKETFEL